MRRRIKNGLDRIKADDDIRRSRVNESRQLGKYTKLREINAYESMSD